ncbi:TlpA family protein disulfide reductase [bacterium]|nr:TlpA family protein disulfide reductase [bacterium]
MRQLSLTLIAIAILTLMTSCPTGQSGTETASGGGSSAASSSGGRAASGWGNAPDFSYTAFDGTQHKLSEKAGTPLVVNFWAGWCPPCKQEMPEFEKSYVAHNGAFEIIAVAVDSTYDPQGFFESQGFSYIGGLDIDGKTKYVGQSIPVTVFIDRNGNQVARNEGRMTLEMFEEYLAKIL